MAAAMSPIVGGHIETVRVVNQQSQNSATPKPAAPAPRAPGNPLASLFGNGFPSGSRGHQRRRGPGWTQAQVQRRARKAKNVRRHRAACR